MHPSQYVYPPAAADMHSNPVLVLPGNPVEPSQHTPPAAGVHNARVLEGLPVNPSMAYPTTSQHAEQLNPYEDGALELTADVVQSLIDDDAPTPSIEVVLAAEQQQQGQR